jgi:ubiquinone biosynthesis UbiH/UbiF/VisC/COQ6 family hydroxylase
MPATPPQPSVASAQPAWHSPRIEGVMFDMAIVGAGTAGLALARAARGLRVALVAPECAPRAPEGEIEARVYALSPGNAAFLAALGAWQAIAPERIAPVHAMQVHGDAAGAIEFDAYRAGARELAWIVEERALLAALWQGLEVRDGLEVIAPAQCRRLELGAAAAQLELDDGRRLAARLVVGADGANSLVRSEAGIAAAAQDYGQRGVVANFACQRAHGNVARQWFQGGPVLALLPLPGQRVSMVWSTGESEAARLLALDATALAREVAAAAGGALGELAPLTAARAFPLRRLAAEAVVAARVALVGDAAHVVHPLAGQGANLGLQDARVLAAVLAAREPWRDAGDLRLLRRYARARAGEALAMQATVHGLHRLFAAHAAPLAWLRNAGLNLSDRLPVIKNLLIRQAMT